MIVETAVLAAVHILWPQIATWIGAGATGIGVAGVVWRTRGFVGGEQLQGQLAAKDVIIQTNEQTIDALEHRVAALEESLRQLVDDNRSLHVEVEKQGVALTKSQISYEELQKVSEHYSAPAAFKHFEKEFVARTVRFDKIEAALVRIEDKLNG